MKQSKKILFAFVLMLSAFTAILYTSCQKDPTCSGVCLNGGSCINGVCRCLTGYFGLQCQYAKLIYKNNTYTTACLSIKTKHVGINSTSHDTVIYIKSSATAEYYGNPYDTAIVNAYTFGPFGPTGDPSKDNQFGVTVYWDNLRTTFLPSGPVYVNLDISPDFFFLQINNQFAPPIGSNNINNIDVNTDFTNTSVDTVIQSNIHPSQQLHVNGSFTVINDSAIHNVGYFGSTHGTSVYVSCAASGSLPKTYLPLSLTWDQSYLLYVPY